MWLGLEILQAREMASGLGFEFSRPKPLTFAEFVDMRLDLFTKPNYEYSYNPAEVL